MNACLKPGFERQSGCRFSYDGESLFADSSRGSFENTYIFCVCIYVYRYICITVTDTIWIQRSGNILKMPFMQSNKSRCGDICRQK